MHLLLQVLKHITEFLHLCRSSLSVGSLVVHQFAKTGVCNSESKKGKPEEFIRFFTK